MNYINTIIIDDEVASQALLKEFLLEYCPNVRVINVCSNVSDSVEYLSLNSLDLILLDIDLIDGSGFDVLKKLPDLKAKVIIISAYDQFGITAYRHKVVDYLLKPLNPLDLQASIIHITKQIALENSLNESGSKLPVTVAKKLGLNAKGIVSIKFIDNIIRCEANGNYTYIHTDGQESVLVPKTMKLYCDILLEFGFIRTHRSHLINKKFVQEIRTSKNQVLLNNGDVIPISRNNKLKVIRAFDLKVV